MCLYQSGPDFPANMRMNACHRFAQALKLLRLTDAWHYAQQLKAPESWKALGTAALELLDVDMAIAAYRQLGDASMVLSLESLRSIEDRNLLAGHVLVLLEKDHAQAQVCPQQQLLCIALHELQTCR